MAVGLAVGGRRWQWAAGLAIVPLALIVAVLEHGILELKFNAAQVVPSTILHGHFAGMMISGILACGWFALSLLGSNTSWKNTAGRTILAWLALAIGFNVVAATSIAFGAVRHVTILLVPLLLSMSRPLDVLAERSRLVSAVCWLTLVIGMGLGSLLAHADRQSASVGLAAQQLARELTQQGRRVWFAGDSSLRFHLEDSITLWRGEPSLAINDVLIMPYSRLKPHLGNPWLWKNCRIELRIPLESWNRMETEGDYSSLYAGNRLSLPWIWQSSVGFNGPSGRFLVDELLVIRRFR
jgi:hypothetical protein